MIIPIVFSTDDNYVLPLSVAIQSLKNHKNKFVNLEIYIFYEQLIDENIRVLSSLISKDCKINFVDVTNFFKDKGLYSVNYFSVAMYYRMAAPHILSKYKKIIYLDCDVIVKQCLSEVYNLELGNNIIGAVNEITSSCSTDINSGVMIFNNSRYIEEKILDKSIEYINNNRDLKWPDQQTINHVCEGSKYFLDYKWNFLTKAVLDSSFYIKKYNLKLKDIGIVHYISEYKPWKYINFPFAKVWWKETKKLPKKIKKEIDEKYKKNLRKDKFKDGAIKFMYGSKMYRIFIRIKNKMFKIVYGEKC